MLTIEKISTEPALSALEPEWNLLLSASLSNTITLTFEWVSTWWRVFGEGRELSILTVRDSGELIAVAPLLRRQTRRFGFLPFTRLEFLASGEDQADETCSDYLDFILKRGREPEAIREIAGYLDRHRNEWDEILLPDIPGSSPSLPLLDAACSAAGEKAEIVKRESAVYLPLPDSSDVFLQSLPSSLRWEIRRDLRRATQNDYKLLESTDSASFEKLFAILVHLHQLRWQSRGMPGVFSSEKFTRFHRLLASKVLDKEWIKLYVLLVGGEPVAALHLFTYNRTVFVYQGGMIEGRGLKHPGTILEFLAVENAIREKFTEWDFMKTQPGSYKHRWGKNVRELVGMRIAHNNSKEAIRDTVVNLLSGLRYVKHASLKLRPGVSAGR
jgi:CelD/BcsL family acetyltransferase involved in cellulose biosynthesis